MEYGSRLRFALITIAGIILLILSIWGVSSLARRVINGSSSADTKVKKINLTDYNTSSSFVRVTVEGPIVAKENYKSYQMEVGQNFRDIKAYTGYTGTVSDQKNYSNDSKAYEAFLKALKQANFTSKNTSFGDDETGYCPDGRRYVYELIDHGDTVFRAWGSSCGSGNFTGLGQTTRGLFASQIPDSAKFIYKLGI